jgi:hypothetical protein
MNSDASEVDQTKVRERAYQLWEDEGRPHGRHDEHWFQAERDLANSRQTLRDEVEKPAKTPHGKRNKTRRRR